MNKITREEFEKEFDREFDRDSSSVGYKDTCYAGLQIIAKYTDYVVQAATHDKIWSEDVDVLIEKGITIQDVSQLRDLGWMIEDSSLCHFV